MSLASRSLLMTAAVLAVAGCTARRAPPAPPPHPRAAPVPDRAAELRTIAALLDRGDAAAARVRVAGLLDRDPMDADARTLAEAIDRDPRTLLGAASSPYRVRPGETLTTLAARFLGSPLRAYALARYNGIAVPSSVRPGMVLRIPGAPPAPRRRPPARVAKPHATTDPAAAARARSAALAALAQGQGAQAVTLLREAARLDPEDPLIRRDLARALAAHR